METIRHIRKIDDPLVVLMQGYFDETATVPDGFELVDGEPPEGFRFFSVPTLAEELNAVFETLDEDTQADLAPLKAAVKLELDQGRAGIAKRIIQRASIPAELESVRQAMLGKIPHDNRKIPTAS